jgi:hypothetical protein
MEYTGTGDDDADVVDRVTEWLDTAYDYHDQHMTTQTDFDSIEIRNLTQATDLGTHLWDTLTSGSGSGDSMPLQTAPLVLFNTGVTGSQGRKFLPLVTENTHIGLGDLSGVLTSDLALWAAEMLVDRVLPNGTLACGNWNKDLLRFAEWTTAQVKSWLHTQRRRNKGVGI